MSFHDLFGNNEEVESKIGVIVDYGHGVKVHLLHSGNSNTKYNRLLVDRLKPYRRQMNNESMDEALAARIMAEVYVDSIILGWEGVLDLESNPVPFTRNEAVAHLVAYPKFFRAIQRDAADEASFRMEQREADAKNSKSSSRGK